MSDRAPPRLVALPLHDALSDLEEPAVLAEARSPAPWTVLQDRWRSGDAVLPLGTDPVRAAQVLTALRPDVLALPAADATGDPSPPGPPLPPLPPLPGGTALVVATSATTGPPRGVVLGHAALDAAVHASLERTGADSGDRWLCCLPLDHIAGILVLARAAAAGGTVRVLPRFSVAAVARALDGPRPPTRTSLVPTMLHRLLEAGVAVDRFRTILLGGAAADPVLLDRARAAGATVVTTYGMTETCGGVVYDGIPLDGVGVGLDPDPLAPDGGRIRICGPTLCSGHRDGTDPVRRGPGAAGAWLRTNDLGAWGADGSLVVHGRSDDVIVTGGENVDVGTVVRELRRHPGVRDAAATGVPDPEWGERLEVWVEPEPDARVDHEPATLAAHLAAHLPRPAVPRRIHLVARLPRTPLGKVARAALPTVTVLRSWSRDDPAG